MLHELNILYTAAAKIQLYDGALLCVLGEMQRAAQQSGDLWENGGGARTRSDQAHEVHVLPGKTRLPDSDFYI